MIRYLGSKALLGEGEAGGRGGLEKEPRLALTRVYLHLFSLGVGRILCFPWARIWRANHFVTQLETTCADSFEVTLFRLGREEEGSGGPDVRVAHRTGQAGLSRRWLMGALLAPAALGFVFKLHPRCRNLSGLGKQSGGEGKGAGVCSPLREDEAASGGP